MGNAKACWAVLLVIYSTASSARELPLAEIDQWQRHSFIGESDYQWRPEQDCLLMSSDATASARIWEQTLAMNDQTRLSWRWQQQVGIEGVDQRSKEGDDFSARIYVVVKHPLLFWRSRVLSYVHAEQEAVDEHWPNPFTRQFRMWVVSKGNDDQWHRIERNIQDDWYAAFGDRPERFDAIGLMVDSDNSGQRTRMCLADLSIEQAG